MTMIYSNPAREQESGALPDVEVFRVTGKPDNAVSFRESGYYWWPCFPGCLPDGDPVGPFDTEAEAIADAQAGSDNSATHQVVDFGTGPVDSTQGYPFEGNESECSAWIAVHQETGAEGRIRYMLQEIPSDDDNSDDTLPPCVLAMHDDHNADTDDSSCHPDCGPIIQRDDYSHVHENEDGRCTHMDGCLECSTMICETCRRCHNCNDDARTNCLAMNDSEPNELLPPCVLAMRCYCAGHARGNPASEPCDTSETAPAPTPSLYQQRKDADAAWSAELRRLFGKRAGDVRYTAEGKGAPGSKLRELHDAFMVACYGSVDGAK